MGFLWFLVKEIGTAVLVFLFEVACVCALPLYPFFIALEWVIDKKEVYEAQKKHRAADRLEQKAQAREQRSNGPPSR